MGVAEGGGTTVFDAVTLQQRRLIFNGRHLPYNPDIVSNAKKLRKNMTPAEKKLWFGFLRTFPFRVLRQRPIDNFIADFYCPKLSLVIEVDGGGHFSEKSRNYDKQRGNILKTYGIQVLRFTNNEVILNFEAVCQQIHILYLEKQPLCTTVSDAPYFNTIR
jgi:very-short-patch-repair endonuclease